MAEDLDTPDPLDGVSHQADAIGTSAGERVFAPSAFLPHLPRSDEATKFGDKNPDGSRITSDLSKEGAAAATSGNRAEEPATQSAVKGQVDSHGRTLNPRSCVTCRKRKVKCDKIHPCTNCNRAHIECVFPSPGRAPRKLRKIGEGKDKELLERLRRLEGVVKNMGVDLPRDELAPEQENNQPDKGTSAAAPPEAPTKLRESVTAHEYQGMGHAERTQWVDERNKGRFENRFGRLVVNEGKSRYVNSSFWASLSNEVEDLKGILNQSSDDDDLESSPGTNVFTGAHHGWVFGFSSQNVDILSLHPLPGQIRTYWELYKDRVDPLVKVLHLPTMEATVLSSASHLSNLSKGFEALLFAIYYGVTTSLSPADCELHLGEDKSVLLSRYRFAIEQSLARANFLTTEETVVLQAFVLFLICLRRNSDARVIWTLTGLVVRIAQTIGIHRDGYHFGLSPFEVEMRRRLWWQVCILDIRASEDHGCDPTIVEQAFDTKMPSNINDVDITPGMKEPPTERRGCTDMSFCLLRFEVANTFRRINYVPPGSKTQNPDAYQAGALEDKVKWITECHKRLEERYLKHCDMSVPLFWVTATVARLMMSKMWLMVYHPFQRQSGGANLPSETKDKLFITSLENIEYALLLESEARTMKWGWLFKTYVQWHALAFMLSELCHRTTGDFVERAWSAVEKTRDGRWGMSNPDDTRAGHLWRPLKKLYRKAKEARQRGLQEEAMTKTVTAIPRRTYSPNTNPMFEHPSRPRVVRAPLSKAQLSRFANGPEFGQMPIDKHELLSPPQISDRSLVNGEPDAMDVAAPTNAQQSTEHNFQPLAARRTPSDPEQSQLRQPLNPAYPRYNAVASSLPPDFQCQGPPFGANLITGANANVDYSDLEGTLDTSLDNTHTSLPNANVDPMSMYNSTQTSTTTASMTQGLAEMPLDRASMESSPNMELGDLDMSVMDTSGDLNWENWNELVRQFGTDVDPAAPGVGAAADWGGPNWDSISTGQNIRANIGANGGWY